MDFLDTRDSNVSKKRSRRVRSWYLYEQYKSLEKNQVEAAEKLKERSYQDKILRQELNERRARRKLYDQIGITASESINDKNSEHNKNEGTKSLCTSSDDIFGTYAELQENEYVIRETEVLSDPSQADSLNDQDDDYKTVEDHITTATETTSVTDVNSEETMIEDYRTSETANVNTINLSYDEVKEQLENLGKFTEFCDEADGMSVSICSDDFKDITKRDISVYTQDNSLLTLWSKLVTFAYQVIELNHGNCYCDYGSQLLTAVLACDVIRRGINKMCDILQPYVSPIKFATDQYSESLNYCHKSVRRKKPQNKNNKKSFRCKINCKPRPKNFARKYRSEHWQHCAMSTDNNRRNKIKCRSCEPWRRDQRNQFYFDCTSTKSSSSKWPEFCNDSSRNLCCGCGSRVIKPMFKLSQYIDTILKEIEEKYN